MDIFRILSGILHMGNVLIEKDERAIDKCFIAVSSDGLFVNLLVYCHFLCFVCCFSKDVDCF